MKPIYLINFVYLRILLLQLEAGKNLFFIWYSTFHAQFIHIAGSCRCRYCGSFCLL